MDLPTSLSRLPRVSLATLPTPLHRLARLTSDLGGPELWIKRDDLTGLAGGGNKTRKLEFLAGDALRTGADTLVTVGAVQSNHTRQTAGAAARLGLDCVLLHNGWTTDPGPSYRRAGNLLISDLLGARLLADDTPRPLGDAGSLAAVVDELRDRGRRPYLVPGGASDHPRGGMGYALCAAEIAAQAAELGVTFDHVLHCTGSGSTQAGLLAGFAAIGSPTKVIGVSDDGEKQHKQERVLRLANATLTTLGLPPTVSRTDVEVVVADENPYGVASDSILDAIRRLARTEGLLADPVYEGRTILGLIQFVEQRRLTRDDRVLVLHLGGDPAIHAYAEQVRGSGLLPVDQASRRSVQRS